MTTLFSCLFGSSLYGTQTPTSDRDIKRITLPTLGSLLVGHAPKNVVHKTNKEKNTRNTVNDIDEELIPVQVFARDFFAGQTYALEMAFALEGTHAEQEIFDSLIFTFVQELRKKFLTSNIKAMMGYVINQANMYSLKGERLNLLNEFKGYLKNHAELHPDTKLGELYSLAEGYDHEQGFAGDMKALEKEYPKYFKITEYDIGDGRMRPCFVVNEKVFPFTNTAQHSYQVLLTMMGKYGARAEQAREMNVDWKAMMHALRIVDEGLELLQNRVLTFPFKPETVAYYLSVKRGEVDIDLVRAELGEKLERLKVLEQTTTLKSSKELQAQFDAWLESWMYKFYGLKTNQAESDEIKSYEIWVEGFNVTGNESLASLAGTSQGASFKEACAYFAECDVSWAKHYDAANNTWWGCRLFENESEARVAFG